MRSIRFLAAASAAALLLLAGCGDDNSGAPTTPATVALAEEAFTFTALGQNHLLVAHAMDRGGHEMSADLAWSTSNPSVVKVNGDGLATAMSVGEAVLSVSTGGVADSMHVIVSQAPAHIYAEFGDGQTGVPGEALFVPLTVSVSDALGYRIHGIQVHFTSNTAGGGLTTDTATTDFSGEAFTNLSLGNTEGDYTVTATVPGTGLSVNFTARAANAGPFNIEVVFLTNATPGQRAAFAAAEARWESIITADLPDDYATLPAYSCGASPAMDRPIDDLVIFVQIGQIDGPGGILGGGGPCFTHEVGGLPAIGGMVFDSDDLDGMEADGTLTDVITHEMGHVLGIGSIWSDFGFLADPSLEGGLDPHFTGPLALTQFDNLGGGPYTGAKVPVENQGGQGTADAHWRETVFGSELMTGFIGAGSNPLSAVTIASLADLGYSVDMSKADAFTLGPFIRRAPSGVLRQLRNDIRFRPTGVIGPRGTPVRPYRR